ncbi:MAG: PilZ domain-containing protein [Pyrinomonadaceae bacterium]
MTNRRQFERKQAYLNAYLEGVLGRHRGTVSDISLGGCYILTEGAVEKGELIRIEIQSPTGEWVYLWGETAHYTEEIGVGVKFFSDEPEHSVLNGLMDSLNAKKTARALLEKLVIATQRNISLDRYNELISQTLYDVGSASAILPEEIRTKISLAMEPYIDAAQAWKATSEGPQGRQLQIAVHKNLSEKYADLPAEASKAVLAADPAPVLAFLWERGRMYLNFAL